MGGLSEGGGLERESAAITPEKVRERLRTMREQREHAARQRREAIEMRERVREMRELLAGDRPPWNDLGHQAFRALPTPAALVGRRGQVLAANPSWHRLLRGRRLSQGRDTLAALAEEGAGSPVADAVRQVIETATRVDLETDLAGGGHFQVQVAPVASEPQAALVVMIDLTDQHQREEHLLFEATHDSLTGLANRAALVRELEQSLALARRYGQRLGLIYLDIDEFKAINDTHGHVAGDQVLAEIARRWMPLVRDTDLLARAGGDEFVVLVRHLEDSRQLDRLASRLRGALQEPIAIGETGVEVVVDASAGMAEARPAASVEQALAVVDHAMYQAKKARESTDPGEGGASA